MAGLKHIKNTKANYSESLEYLLFQHEEKNGKEVFDVLGREPPLEEYHIVGFN